MTLNFKLGRINPKELLAANFRVKEAREKLNPPKDFRLHEVAVAVYVDGRLQFHGGETVGVPNNVDLTRSTMLEAVCHVVKTINPTGKVAFTECEEIPQ